MLRALRDLYHLISIRLSSRRILILLRSLVGALSTTGWHEDRKNKFGSHERAISKLPQRAPRALQGNWVKDMEMNKSSGFLAGLRRFVRVEDGLVTVEWVALTAGMVIAAIAIGYTVMNTTKDASKNIGGGIEAQANKVYSGFGP